MSAPSLPDRAPLIVLIVDDSPVARRVLAQSLSLAGLPIGEVREAASGEEALSSIARGDPDFVLCDVHMPRMDGTEFLERLAQRGFTSRVPVVMVSSGGGSAAPARLRELGARAYLEKPFYPETLGRVVRCVLGIQEVR